MPNVCNGVRALGRTSNKRKTNLAEQTVVVPATKRQLKSLSLSLSRLWNVENASDCESILFGRRPFFWSTAPSIKGEVRRNGAGLGLKWIKAVRSFHFFCFFSTRRNQRKTTGAMNRILAMFDSVLFFRFVDVSFSFFLKFLFRRRSICGLRSRAKQTHTQKTNQKISNQLTMSPHTM